MKPVAFSYQRPESVAAALELLAAGDGEARPLAGGQSLVPMLNMRLARPAALIDLNRLDDLAQVRVDGDGLRIGAMVRQRAVEADARLAASNPLLGAVVRQIGHVTNRNRGTVGGSICHADPAAELPALALLFDAELHVASVRGRRALAARDFFDGSFSTVLADDELLTEVRLPQLEPGGGWAVAEFTRRGGDFAIAGALATLSVDAEDTVTACRLAAFGVGARPVRLAAAEQLMTGATLDDELVAAAADSARGEVEPRSDGFASARYRRELVAVMCRRALRAAWARSTNGRGERV